MFKEERTFKNSRGLRISALYEGYDKIAPTILLCHGHGSSKTSISTSGLAKRLLNMGFCVYRFDFTGCGQSQGELTNLSPLVGLDDLKSAVKDLGKKRFALYGSSFGGYVALMCASKNTVMALGLKAPVSDYPAVIKAHEDKKLKVNILEDTKGLDLYKEAKNIKCPVLIVHGDADNTVPLTQSKNLLKHLEASNKSLKIITGAPHVLRGKYLSSSNTLVSNFFKQTLLK